MPRRFWIPGIERIARYAADPGDSDEWRLKKSIGVTTAMVGSAIFFGYSLLYFAFNEPATGLVMLVHGLVAAVALVAYRFFRRYGAFVLLSVSNFAISVLLANLLLGGFGKSGSVIVWILMVPMLPLVVYEARFSLVGYLAAVATLIVNALLEPYQRPTNNLPPALITVLYVLHTLGTLTFIFITAYYYVRQNQILSRLLYRENEKAEALLLNILPKEIAAILKNEKRVVADQFDGASILFADIVNFTPLSATMTPAEVVDLLNEVFSRFDALVERYGLEKIKTIGDCYMAAAGVPRPRADHAQALTRLALDIRDLVSRQEFRGHKLAFRIGLNSGPVVAGVIGRKKFIYDLWGDAVNTASRMESQGAGGSIQITDATHALIKDDFVCEPRGIMSVKGKGEMPVWYVLGPKAAAA